MVELKTQHPYIDFNGNERTNLVKTYAEDENSVRYKIMQVQTSVEYDEAVDVYPSKFTYVVTNNKIEEEIEE